MYVQHLKLGDHILEVVDIYKYLGNQICYNLSDSHDIMFRLDKFYSSSNSVLRNFKSVDFHPLNQLFNSYCKPVHGISLWNDCNTTSSQSFRIFENAYNSSLKQILDVSKYTSNHVTAAMLNQLLFGHYLAFMKLKYLQRILKSNMLMVRINTPYIQNGFFGTDVYALARRYQVDANEDLDALKARIHYVQNHEVRNRECMYFLI